MYRFDVSPCLWFSTLLVNATQRKVSLTKVCYDFPSITRNRYGTFSWHSVWSYRNSIAFLSWIVLIIYFKQIWFELRYNILFCLITDNNLKTLNTEQLFHLLVGVSKRQAPKTQNAFLIPMGLQHCKPTEIRGVTILQKLTICKHRYNV